MIASWVAAAVLIAQATIPHPVVGTATVPGSPPRVGAPEKRIVGVEELGPVLTAASAIAVDVESGAVLFGKQPHAVRPLASITKLLAVLAILQRSSEPGELVGIVAEDIPPEGGTRLLVGDRVTIQELLSLSLVASDNAAIAALARTHGGTVATVAKMQDLAREYGLHSVRVRDVSGLDPWTVGSATDAATLLMRAAEAPGIAQRMTLSEITVDPHRIPPEPLRALATNVLLRDGFRHAFAIRGGKTGYLDEAGSNLAIIVERDGHRVAVVVLGSASRDDRFRDARVLADWVFRNYEW